MQLINETNELPSKRQAGRGKALVDRAVREGRLSPDDVAYIKVATDPYHDTAIEHFNGIPDDYPGKSITEIITSTVTVQTPYGAGSGNYNCRIYNYPFLGTQQIDRSTSFSNYYKQEANVASPKNYVTIGTGNVDYSLGEFSDYPTYITQIAPPDSALVGSIKIAGLGIEVVNTTAELYKQGMCSIARMPQMMSSNVNTARIYGNGGPAAAFSTSNCIPIVSPPTTLAELTTYPDYRQWEAKEGAYAVIRQYDVASHSPMGDLSLVRFVDDEPIASSIDITDHHRDTSHMYATAGGVYGTDFYQDKRPVISCPSDSVVMFFTGLSESTTMTVRFKWFIERRVNTSIPALQPLVPFVKDSPSINPEVIQLVSMLWRELPPAVMFKENPAGEWFDRILAGIGEYGPKILGMIPHPVAQMAAQAIPHGIKAVNAIRGKEESTDELRKEIERLKLELERRGVQRTNLQIKAVKAAGQKAAAQQKGPKVVTKRPGRS